eukprot:UC4_evm2s1590
MDMGLGSRPKNDRGGFLPPPSSSSSSTPGLNLISPLSSSSNSAGPEPSSARPPSAFNLPSAAGIVDNAMGLDLGNMASPAFQFPSVPPSSNKDTNRKLGPIDCNDKKAGGDPAPKAGKKGKDSKKKTSTSKTKKGKRDRSPEPKEKRIPRPMNSFMVYAKEQRKILQIDHPNLDNKVISKMLGDNWKKITPEDKEKYVIEAKKLAEIHKEKYPDWKFKRDTSKNKKAKKDEVEEPKARSTQPSSNNTTTTIPASEAPLSALSRQHSDPSTSQGITDAGVGFGTRVGSRSKGIGLGSNAGVGSFGSHVSLGNVFSGRNIEQTIDMQKMALQQRRQLEQLQMLHQSSYAKPPPSYVSPPSIEEATKKSRKK